MKTTLNPFENAKRTANGTGGGVSPAVIEEMQAEISILGSQNKTQAQDITDIKGSLNSINDNLSGFKFYPIGTDLVALVADDSFYIDANGKYVLADSPTGQSMIDNVTYKALASTEDLRGKVGADTASPFNTTKLYRSIQNANKFYVSDRTEKPKILMCYQMNGTTALLFDISQETNKYLKVSPYSIYEWKTIDNTTTDDTIGYDENGMYICQSKYNQFPYTCVAVY